MKWSLLILLVSGVLCAKAQSADTLTRGNGYVVYYGDTSNRYNAKGERDGWWKVFDSSVVVTKTISIACSFGEKRTSTTTEILDTIHEFTLRMAGYYENGLKEGTWKKLTKKTKKEKADDIDGAPDYYIDFEIFYEEGIIKNVKVYDKNGLMDVYAIPKPNSYNADYIFYDDEGHVVRKGEMFLDMLLEM